MKNKTKYLSLLSLLVFDFLMEHEAILYSLDHTITKKQLQEKESVIYDEQKYTKLQERSQEQKIESLLVSQSHKFFSLQPCPYILYYIWDISLLDKKILGIVGPRRMSNYGEKVIEKLFDYAGEYDMVTISGMAEGVDQLCHKHSIKNNIPTIAVLGGGLGRYLRREESKIIQNIVDAGWLVVSEYRLFQQPTNYSFPQRNRIIAGFSDVLFLPEAGKKSWSLITVEFALEMKVPVYATPSSIFSPTSEGILHLIETGHVKPVVDIKHFLHQHFPSQNISSRKQTSITLTDEEQSITSILSHDQWISLQSIVSQSWIDVEKSIQLLTMLEIKGVVAQNSPGEYLLV